jgi:hypothetical protein
MRLSFESLARNPRSIVIAQGVRVVHDQVDAGGAGLGESVPSPDDIARSLLS